MCASIIPDARTSPLLPIECAYHNIVVTYIHSRSLELLAAQLLPQDDLTVQRLSGSLIVAGVCRLEQGVTPKRLC